MTRNKIYPVLVGATWLLLSGCGQEKVQSGEKTQDKIVKGGTAEIRGQGGESGVACDLLNEALASEKGWAAVTRGEKEFLGRSLILSDGATATLKLLDASFDPSMKCFQVLKSESGAMVEIAAGSCNEKGAIGEARQFKIGKLLPNEMTATAETSAEKDTAKETPKATCLSSRHELIGTEKTGEIVMGELLINKSTEMIETKPTRAQSQHQEQGKGEEKSTFTESHSYEFILDRVNTPKAEIKAEEKPVVLGEQPQQQKQAEVKPVERAVESQKPEQKPEVLGEQPQQQKQADVKPVEKPVVLGAQPQQQKQAEVKPVEKPVVLGAQPQQQKQAEVKPVEKPVVLGAQPQQQKQAEVKPVEKPVVLGAQPQQQKQAEVKPVQEKPVKP